MKIILYNYVNRFLRRFGLAIIPVREATDKNILAGTYGLLRRDIVKVNASSTGGLQRHLRETNRTRWLEIGCGGTLDGNFHYIDIFPEGIVDKAFCDRYRRVDIVNASEGQLQGLGRFDFIRMQHVFEHFPPEDGGKVLKKCAQLLNSDGYLLITTPDLRIHARTYLGGGYKNDYEMQSFNECAWKRIKKDSPDSFYFSMATHCLLYERHMWCYDYEGLKYMLLESGEFDDILEISIDHPFASYPFTHNRPEEDVCVLARKSN